MHTPHPWPPSKRDGSARGAHFALCRRRVGQLAVRRDRVGLVSEQSRPARSDVPEAAQAREHSDELGGGVLQDSSQELDKMLDTEDSYRANSSPPAKCPPSAAEHAAPPGAGLPPCSPSAAACPTARAGSRSAGWNLWGLWGRGTRAPPSLGRSSMWWPDARATAATAAATAADHCFRFYRATTTTTELLPLPSYYYHYRACGAAMERGGEQRVVTVTQHLLREG